MSQERHWLERSERSEPFAGGGCLLESQAQRVSVLACTLPLAVVISYSTAHRGVWACTTAPKDNASPHRYEGFATVLQPTGGSQGLVFPFSHSPPVKYVTGAETSAPVGSVLAPKNKQDQAVSVTLTLQAAWLSQPTGLPGRAASSSFLCVYCTYVKDLMAGAFK